MQGVDGSHLSAGLDPVALLKIEAQDASAGLGRNGYLGRFEGAGRIEIVLPSAGAKDGQRKDTVNRFPYHSEILFNG